MATRFPDIPRRVSGFNLDELAPARGGHVARALVGTESTCAFTTEATLRLVTSPPGRCLVALGFRDIFLAAEAVPALLAHPLLALEGFDRALVDQMEAHGLNRSGVALLPEGNGWLLAELGGDSAEEARSKASDFIASLPAGLSSRLVEDGADQKRLWAVRESGLGATAIRVDGHHNYEGWEDGAVAPERLADYLRGITALWAEHGYSGAWYGHFGQGCVHTRNNFDLSSRQGLRNYRSYVTAAADLVVSIGGSLSGEHGDGQSRGELLEKMFGPELVGAFAEFKALWDPDGLMNPGKVVDPYPLDANVRYLTLRDARSLAPHAVLLRRGRGLSPTCLHALRRGRPLPAGRHGHHVPVLPGHPRRDPLDSGTSQVAGRNVPGRAGAIDLAQRRGARGPRTLLVVQRVCVRLPDPCRHGHLQVRVPLPLLPGPGAAPGHVRHGPHTVGEPGDHGLAGGGEPGQFRPGRPGAGPGAQAHGRHRHQPPRAPVLGRRRAAQVHRARPARALDRAPGDTSVVIWPDTFTDAFRPQVGTDLVVAMEALGERVAVPSGWACCGRTLYDFGMLDLARRSLRRLLKVLGPWVSAGVPVVVAEPSCLAAFRDELPALLADDPRSAKLASLARSPAEHMVASGHAARWAASSPTAGTGRAVVHAHCHQRAVVGTEADEVVLSALGYQVELLDAGCCGLAGSFGFNAGHEPRLAHHRGGPVAA